MSLRMLSNVAIERWLTALQVLFRRWIGAVPRAEMMEVRVEKLFNCRHFCIPLATRNAERYTRLTHICYVDKMLNHNHSALDILLGKDHLCNPVC